MRILLAAASAQKGDLDGNLARHLAALDQARVQGCQLAVFPEFSLTGSVDPRTHPQPALGIDAGPVRALLAATSRTGWRPCSGSPNVTAGRSTSPSCTATTAGSGRPPQAAPGRGGGGLTAGRRQRG